MKWTVVVLMFVSVVALGQPSSNLFYGNKDINFNVIDYDSMRTWQSEMPGHGIWWQDDATKDCFFMKLDSVGIPMYWKDVSAGTWYRIWGLTSAGAVTMDSMYLRTIKTSAAALLGGALTLSPTVTCDTNAFSAALSVDTVTVTGAATSDKYIVTYRSFGVGWDSLGTLTVRPTATGFIVARDTAAARLKPNAKYTWLRVK
jgi:hypothetical protein